MRTAQTKGTKRPVLAVRSWPLWSNRRWLAMFIVSVTCIDAIAIGVSWSMTSLRLLQLVLFVFLLAGSLVTVERTRRAGENAGVIKDVYGVWELPIALLLPPVYALIAPIPRMAMMQWRGVSIPVHRRVFTAAAVSLSYGATSVAFHAVNQDMISHVHDVTAHATVRALAMIACGALQWMINTCLVLAAVKGSDPTINVRKQALAREPLTNDATEVSVAVLVALAAAVTPIAAILAAPFATLLQRSQRHAQLVNDSRLDAKTGLLNAGTWDREANAEVTRANRTRTSLAVALLDIDKFKDINDTYGHLAGDKALKELARTIKIFLREYDLVGRFGGEEFSLLLPQTDEQDARRVAERMRAAIAEMPIEVGENGRSVIIRLTVSIGVAALSTTGSQLTELLATADAALYRAKHAGRNQVWVTTDTASFSSYIDSGG
ncbi:MAG: GGDEF domain-containing protein [Streptosporangiaceae bacterium]|jgi:diguanylate cyclase (GGDEF)-like protein